MTDEEIREAIKYCRSVAEPIGPQHAWWDLIFDAEAMLTGGQTLVPYDVVKSMLREARDKAVHTSDTYRKVVCIACAGTGKGPTGSRAGRLSSSDHRRRARCSDCAGKGTIEIRERK